jgi:hypothetical protein
MYFRPVALILCLLVCVPAPPLARTLGDNPDKKTGEIERLIRLGSPDELAAHIAKLLPAATKSELDRLSAVSDRTTAMAAGWERVRRTMPEAERPNVVTPDLLAVSRFLGLIEGRLQVPIPMSWQETVMSAKGYGQQRIWFPRSDLVPAERAREPSLVERDGARWLVLKDNESIKLPSTERLAPLSHASAECAGEWAYIALYDSLNSSSYRLFAIDRTNGRVAWSSKVWGLSTVVPRGAVMNTSGSDWHVVIIRLSPETLAVFGFSFRAAYVEVFDRKTGENQCRFSTAYCDAVATRK